MTDIEVQLRTYPDNLLQGHTLLLRAADHIAAQDKRIAELDRFERMFMAACESLGDIHDALGLDQDDADGTLPILEAIAELQVEISSAKLIIDSSPANTIDAERYRYLRNLSEDDLGAIGVPSIAIADSRSSGNYASHEDADNAIDASMKAAK